MDLENSIASEVRSTLPSLEENKVAEIVASLLKDGVEAKEHLALIEEQDLAPILNKISARILLASWKKYGKRSTRNNVGEDTSTEEGASLNDTTNEQVDDTPEEDVNDTHDEDVARTRFQIFDPSSYHIPSQVFPRKLTEALEECCSKQSLLPLDLRRTLVRVIADDIHLKCERPGRSSLRCVASKLANKYPCLLEHLKNGEIIGTGYTALSLNLENRIDNLNRKRACVKKIQQQVPFKSKKRDSYGCTNYSPSLTPSEFDQQKNELCKLKQEFSADEPISEAIRQSMKTTFPLQRYFILEGHPVLEIEDDIPFLFKNICYSDHVEELMGLKFKDPLNQINKKVPGILAYINKRKPISTPQSSHTGVAVLQCLCHYFGEPDSLGYRISEEMSVEDLTACDDLPSVPCIVYNDASPSWICVDKRVVLEADLPLDALYMFITSFFVLSLQYPTSHGATLEFFQRYLLKINPERGSKIKFTNGRKRHCGMHPKVLSLVTCLSTEESLGLDPATLACGSIP